MNANLRALAGFGLIFAIFYGGASRWTSTLPGPLPSWDFAFEQRVPFVPWTAIIYLTITPVLLLSPWMLRERTPMFAFALSVETILATVCFLLFPQTVAWHRPDVANAAFRLADAMNLSYNNFPSLHVAFAVSAAWAYRRIGWWLWAAAVALSTWLMWEHHLADILGGIALALIVMRIAESLAIELTCLVQCARFSRRHIRYFVIFLAIWMPSLLHWRRYRAVRYGFVLAQWIDDLLDGDRPSKREPLEVVDELLASRLARAFFNEITPQAREEFLALVDCMRVDRVRVMQRERWDAERLDEHHRRTFTLSVNLMLHTAHANARAEQVPALVDALAWCSVFRDLEEDQSKGLDNIPLGEDVEDWTRTTHARALLTLQRSAVEIAALDDPRARRIVGTFQRSIEKFAGATAARIHLRMPQTDRDLPPHLRPLDPPPPPLEPLPLEELPPPPRPPSVEDPSLPDPFLRRT